MRRRLRGDCERAISREASVSTMGEIGRLLIRRAMDKDGADARFESTLRDEQLSQLGLSYKLSLGVHPPEITLPVRVLSDCRSSPHTEQRHQLWLNHNNALSRTTSVSEESTHHPKPSKLVR